ncbi:hypothetical protein ACHAXS_013492 [Conticribra weissflogii]
MNNDIVADGISPRRADGQHDQLPTRMKTFLRHNRHHPRIFLLPLLYAIFTIIYFYGLLFRDVGSGMHIRQNLSASSRREIHEVGAATAKLWGDPNGTPIRLEPRSLPDIVLANAEVAWKYRSDREEYLKKREEKWKEREEERRKVKQEKMKLANNVFNETDQDESELSKTNNELLSREVQNLPNATSHDQDSKKLSHMSRRRTKQIHRNPMKMRKEGSPTANDPGFLPVLIVIFSCTLFRVCVSLTIGRLSEEADSADDDENANRIRRGGLNSFLTTMSGGREAARLRRRARQRHFQNFVDRLNAQRRLNGERQISAEALRLVVSSRDFHPNDYDRLLQFNEENGPAIGSIFSILGASEAEIGRCPSRVLAEGDDLLKERRTLEEGNSVEQRHSCSICLEPYQVGDTVRTIPCFHTFHSCCIDPWLREKAECPICKHSAIG